MGAFDLSGIRARVPGLATPAPEPPQPEPVPHVADTPLARAIRTGNAQEVRDALGDHPLADDQVETAINLLAWDEVAPAAIRSLAVAARTQTPVLLRAPARSGRRLCHPPPAGECPG